MKKLKIYKFLYNYYSYIFKKFKKINNLFSFIFSFIFTKNENNKKLLFIYDLTNQPFSVGDFLVANAASIAICEKNLLNEIDLLIIFDINKLNNSTEFKYINSDNVYYNIASILPIAQVNQKLNSILIFNNKPQLNKYITDNKERYFIYPKLLTYALGNYLYWDAMNKIFPEYYLLNKHAPLFKCREHLIVSTKNFFKKYIRENIAVTINLRNNKVHGQNRNSNIKEWNKFFEYCNNKFNVKFIIICSLNEIDNSWLKLKNVVVAKEHHTNIEHDLTLINFSSFHMGSPSGPFSMAWFGTKPYINFNIEIDRISEYSSIVKIGEYYKFSFASDNQLMIDKPEQFDIILSEFTRIYNSISKIRINYSENSLNAEGLPYLR